MGEYFSGWRRKIGVLTLVMACVFMGTWLRNQDGVSFASGEQRRFGLFVSDGFFILSTPKNADSTNQDFVIWESNDSGFIKQLDEKSLVKWYWCGIGTFQNCGQDGSEMNLLMIPPWSITIPLTALSAFLLLKKPRISNQKKLAELTENEGGA